jgi:hypothetical protein
MDQWVTHTHLMGKVEAKTTPEAQAQGGEGGGSVLVLGIVLDGNTIGAT